MKKQISAILCLLSLVGLCLAQSGISNPTYKPHARIIIPVQQQPEFSGTQTTLSTNTVWNLSGWSTNVFSFTTASNGLVSVTNTAPIMVQGEIVTTNTAAVVNTNAFAFCDFELFAVDQANPENPVFYTTSVSMDEWSLYPTFKGNDWSTVELR